jgi:hypothetical protein
LLNLLCHGLRRRNIVGLRCFVAASQQQDEWPTALCAVIPVPGPEFDFQLQHTASKLAMLTGLAVLQAADPSN